MIITLSVILLLLLVIVGDIKGIKTFASFYLSLFFIMLYVLFMKMGMDALFLSFGICILASLFIIFILNGYNIKTKSSFISVIIVFLIMSILSLLVVNNASIQGLTETEIESLGGFNLNINYNMNNLIMGVILVSVIGTIIDTSISISSALYEVYQNNKHLSFKELYESGMNIGNDILVTTINTLFFALIIDFIGFFLFHLNAKIWYIINCKAFTQSIIILLTCLIASVLIIPLTSYVTSKFIVKLRNN